MDTTLRNRLARLLWLGVLVFLIAVWLYPVSNRLTRAGGLALFVIVWFGLIGLCWRRRALRFALLGVTGLCAVFLALPARRLPPAESLRSDYVTALRHYEGVAYYWGGESPVGIDCSGLIRRGLIDSLFSRGLRAFDPGLVRRALPLWWNDCTASALGEARDCLTVHILDTPSLNQLDHSKIVPGDLAVTSKGNHIMAYVGGNTWIEADPGAGRVISVSVPEHHNAWFNASMKIVRWKIFSQ